MSYPEFMQRRSTKPEQAIVEDVDTFGLPGMRNAGPMENTTTTNFQEEQQRQEQVQQKNVKCIKDIWQAAIEGDVECLEANVKLGVSFSQLGQPLLSTNAASQQPLHNSTSNTSGGASGNNGLWGPLFDRCALFRATPLQFACAYNRIEAAKYLLDQGASWEQLSSTGVSAKDYARRRNYLDILRLIEEKEHARKEKKQ